MDLFAKRIKGRFGGEAQYFALLINAIGECAVVGAHEISIGKPEYFQFHKKNSQEKQRKMHEKRRLPCMRAYNLINNGYSAGFEQFALFGAWQKSFHRIPAQK